jgi:hypothetical protein
MRSWIRVLTIGAVVSMMMAACAGDDGSTTTTTAADATTLPPAPNATTATVDEATTTTAAADEATTTPTTGAPAGIPEYEIAFRGTGDVADTVVILLDPATYTTLSDVDIQEVIRDVYDQFPPVATAHVVDSEEAVPLVVEAGPLADEELTVLDAHYFARLEDGIRIVYVGPYAEYPIAILGS